MAKFTVYSSETVYYQNYVEADTAEEARELLLSGGYDLTQCDSGGFDVDVVEEIVEDDTSQIER